jgi:ABC-type branched-subunit amino acid transport system substrate-binding protein
VDDDDVGRFEFVEMDKLAHGRTRGIHKGLRFDEEDFFSANETGAHQAGHFFVEFKGTHAPNFSEVVETQEAGIVTGEGMIVVRDVNDITIGVIIPLTGNASFYGVQMQQAIELAAREAHLENVNIVYRDSRCDPNKAVEELQEITRTYPIYAVIGDACSQSTAALVSVAAEKKIVIISPAASDKSLNNISTYFFRTVPVDQFEGAFTSDRVMRKELTQYAIVPHNTNGFRTLYQAEYAMQPGAFASQAFDAFDAIARTLKEGARTPDEIRTTLYGIEFQGASGIINFDSYGNVLNPYQMYLERSTTVDNVP